jgi:asparagine synthetase B (glutamine-hydrolysing)
MIFLQSFVRVFQDGTPVCQLKLSRSTVVSAARATISMILTQVVTSSRSQELSDADSKLSWHRDAPLSEPADVAVFRLAELARQEVKVVLSGEGSDELFGGYPKYLFANATRWAGVVPGSVLRHVEKSLPASKSRLGIAMRAISEPSHAERMRGWFAPFTVSERTDPIGRTYDVHQHRSRGTSQLKAVGRAIV